MGWIVVGEFKGRGDFGWPLHKKDHSVMTGPGKRDIKGRDGTTIGEASWVTKIDAARGIDDGWWKKYAWILDTKEDAEVVLGILLEKIESGECSAFNKPDRAWVEEVT